MLITSIESASAYEAPRHFGMRAYQVQGGAISPFGTQVGVSVFEPGGGAEASASTVDRVYVLSSGALTVTVRGVPHRLGPLDSCFIAAGEERSILNEGVLPAVMVTLMPPKQPAVQ